VLPQNSFGSVEISAFDQRFDQQRGGEADAA
jgi:hypothetical protein